MAAACPAAWTCCAQQLRAETRIPKHESARLHLLQKRSWWAREMAGNSRKGLQLTLQLEQEVCVCVGLHAHTGRSPPCVFCVCNWVVVID
jgi:hypothetical protein